MRKRDPLHPRHTDKKTAAKLTADLRRRAEEIARAKATELAEDVKKLTPSEIGDILHELRVHQVQLELQNEELRRTDVELDILRARYFDLFDLAPVGYCTINENGLIVEANLTVSSLLGVARGALAKQPPRRFILKDDQDIYYRHSRQLFETGAPQDFDLRMVKSDGTVFWAHLTTIAANDVDGRRVYRVTLTDVTDSRHMLERIQILNAELEQLALTDCLTHLYNRRSIMLRGAEELKRARRDHQPLALLMLDIDGFKDINDTYGHGAGDLALQRVAAALKSSLRENDILGRLGGDEFAILLPNTPLPGAALLAERIRQGVANMSLQMPGSPGGELIGAMTISIGVAAFSTAMSGLDEVLRNADEAMYRAKDSGRNCVCVAPRTAAGTA